MDKESIKKLIKETIQQELKTGFFTARKITDMPTDSLQVVNRKFVTLNGVSGSRPASSVVGQFYFDTTLGYPLWYNGTAWVDATGTPA